MEHTKLDNMVAPRVLVNLFLMLFLWGPGWATHAAPAGDPLKPIEDTPGLARVLIIGDSISIGYTLRVRELLRGRANVHRVPANATSTGYGLKRLKEWLGTGKWDVIHFNFGLHDAKLPPEGGGHTSVDTYERNLREIVKVLKATGAQLIWSTTTPVPNGGNLAPNRRFADIASYNERAARVMKEQGVAVVDLNAIIAPHLGSTQRTNDVHFNAKGSAMLATEVAGGIEKALTWREKS
jgi:lysophospholipase L1-like esterase